MENVHGIDVSWLHHSHHHTDHLSRISPPSKIEGDAVPPVSSRAQLTASPTEAPQTNGTANDRHSPGPPAQESSTATSNTSQTPSDSNAQSKPQVAAPRPQNRKRGISNDAVSTQAKPGNTGKKDSTPQKTGQRRNSFFSSLSSKFSSSPTSPPSKESPSPKPESPKVELPNPFGAAYSPGAKENEKKEPVSTPYVPAPPKNPSFLQSALRRLSSSGPSSLPGKASGTGSISERKIMNVDPNRDRAKVEDFNQAKLRRVSFCVDVEIAGVARYLEPEPEPSSPPGRRPSLQALEQATNAKKTRDKKIKEKGEGAALKNPQAAVDKKEQGKPEEKLNRTEQTTEINGDNDSNEVHGVEVADSSPPKPTDIDGKETTRKKEKKKRTEQERKERKERKKREAEASGRIPLELIRDESDWETTPAATPPGATTPTKHSNQPTTNPLRIYRRCCQLRETPILKRIVDQISAPLSSLPDVPGTVAILDLTGYEMSLSDIVTFADWLAVVPIRKLVLENCGLTDESLRIILAGVLAVKTAEQSRFNRLLSKHAVKQVERQEERLGVIERLSVKNNPKITSEGWRHIGLFMHLSRSLKAIDVSMIPFPQTSESDSTKGDVCTVISKGLAKRYGGNHLEELIMGDCTLGSRNIGQLIDGAIQCGLRRFGLAKNSIDQDGVQHIVRYLKSSLCEGLDLGGNDVNDHLQILADALDDQNPLFALSLADCSLTPQALARLMPALVQLSNLRFIDLSHNRSLFAKQPDALSMLRRYLPQMAPLKRIHLADVDLTPDHAIAIAEILPECSSLCHLSIMENTRLVELTKGGDPASQEEACAMYAALMSAVRVSNTIIAVDIEVPGPESSEVVKAVAKQVVAYSLRNMERGPYSDTLADGSAPVLDKQAGENVDVAPDILLQLVGHMDGYSDDHDNDEPAADQDYVIGGTGIVKALGVCLGTAEYRSRDISPTGSGAVTPQQRLPKPEPSRKARNMSKNLLDSARKIKARLQPALVREEHSGNDMNYRRLLFLDSTLQRVITRFEEEYPETRVTDTDATEEGEADSVSINTSSAGDPVADAPLSPTTTGDDQAPEEDEDLAEKLPRRPSETSLQAHALTLEEGRMHRFGQSLRRDILRPETLDRFHGTTGTEVEQPHLALLREKLSTLRGDEIKEKIERMGFEEVLKDIGASAEELLALEKEDPEAFEIFKQSQIHAQANIGRLPVTSKLIAPRDQEGS